MQVIDLTKFNGWDDELLVVVDRVLETRTTVKPVSFPSLWSLRQCIQKMLDEDASIFKAEALLAAMGVAMSTFSRNDRLYARFRIDTTASELCLLPGWKELHVFTYRHMSRSFSMRATAVVQDPRPTTPPGWRKYKNSFISLPSNEFVNAFAPRN